MYARVITFQAQAGKLEEAIAIYRDSIMPVTRQQKGFKNATLLTDISTGKGVSITQWETEADQKASETNGYLQQVLGKIGVTFAGPPIKEGFAVSVQV
ncbi:MAG: antibiotic biosynthesis monooxygenase [Proteobacteria bacterium]|nr:antibiotic biosynthesis monooxygenase [Pseudomonadota bacterium]